MSQRARLVATALLSVGVVGCAGRVDRKTFDQTYLAGRHNWAFRARFPRADRLLNAFDYGHATLYQTLITHADAAARLEGPIFDDITTHVLRHPPAVPLDEDAVGPDYAKLVPELVAVFGWAHMLHRQVYDACSVAGVSEAQRDAEVARVLAYYRTRRDLALSGKPKSMDLMEAQPYSTAFRREAPKFNGLLWSYHWFQLALYDALLAGGTQREMQTGVDSAVARFFALLDEPPTQMPDAMPMAPAASPRFADRYPDAAIVFDNLHALHDVVADILASPVVPHAAKRTTILSAVAAYQDDTTAVMALDEWRHMARMHGRQ